MEEKEAEKEKQKKKERKKDKEEKKNRRAEMWKCVLFSWTSQACPSEASQ